MWERESFNFWINLCIEPLNIIRSCKHCKETEKDQPSRINALHVGSVPTSCRDVPNATCNPSENKLKIRQKRCCAKPYDNREKSHIMCVLCGRGEGENFGVSTSRNSIHDTNTNFVDITYCLNTIILYFWWALPHTVKFRSIFLHKSQYLKHLLHVVPRNVV